MVVVRLMVAFMLTLLVSASVSPADVLAGPKPDVKSLLASMSLEEKVGQLFMVFFEGPEVSDFCREAVEKRHVGGFILYKHVGNVQSPAQVAALDAGLRGLGAKSRLHVAPFVSIDQEGGPVARLTSGATWFPSQMAVAATRDAARLARAQARAQALELAALGVNVNFTPVADVNVNPANPIIGVRSFGSDPAAVSRLVAAAAAGYRGSGVLCCLKHFPGHGDTDVDSHLGLPVSNHGRKVLDFIDFPPFRAGIKAGAPMVMTAHVQTPALDQSPGLPATLSKPALTGALRGELRFRGLIVSDSLGMAAVNASFGSAKAALASFLAGADVLVYGADKNFSPQAYKDGFDLILRTCKADPEAMLRLDESVARILAAKAELKLIGEHDAPVPDAAGLAKKVGTPANLALAGRIAEHSLTLVRGKAVDFPLSAKNTVLVWPKKASPEIEAALREMAGTYGCRLIVTEADPDAEQLGKAAGEMTAAKAEGRDRVVVFSRDAWRYPGQARLIEKAAADFPGAVTVAATGGPYDLKLCPDGVKFVAAYCDVPATIAALGRALFAGAGFPGRLPVKL